MQFLFCHAHPINQSQQGSCKQYSLSDKHWPVCSCLLVPSGDSWKHHPTNVASSQLFTSLTSGLATTGMSWFFLYLIHCSQQWCTMMCLWTDHPHEYMRVSYWAAQHFHLHLTRTWLTHICWYVAIPLGLLSSGTAAHHVWYRSRAPMTTTVIQWQTPDQSSCDKSHSVTLHSSAVDQHVGSRLRSWQIDVCSMNCISIWNECSWDQILVILKA